jgi:hypothetical protein
MGVREETVGGVSPGQPPGDSGERRNLGFFQRLNRHAASLRGRTDARSLAGVRVLSGAQGAGQAQGGTGGNPAPAAHDFIQARGTDGEGLGDFNLRGIAIRPDEADRTKQVRYWWLIGILCGPLRSFMSASRRLPGSARSVARRDYCALIRLASARR